ncbi:hypothetical protein R3P38DRAFT_3356107 [Favolaschia claudopus]|uniref:Uncharacterized protein n=1 Tax=Favolaschia claudopus TaxID=2862362 RepID=A0AAW0BF68_9AGAR
MPRNRLISSSGPYTVPVASKPLHFEAPALRSSSTPLKALASSPAALRLRVMSQSSPAPAPFAVRPSIKEEHPNTTPTRPHTQIPAPPSPTSFITGRTPAAQEKEEEAEARPRCRDRDEGPTPFSSSLSITTDSSRRPAIYFEAPPLRRRRRKRKRKEKECRRRSPPLLLHTTSRYRYLLPSVEPAPRVYKQARRDPLAMTVRASLNPSSRSTTPRSAGRASARLQPLLAFSPCSPSHESELGIYDGESSVSRRSGVRELRDEMGRAAKSLDRVAGVPRGIMYICLALGESTMGMRREASVRRRKAEGGSKVLEYKGRGAGGKSALPIAGVGLDRQGEDGDLGTRLSIRVREQTEFKTRTEAVDKSVVEPEAPSRRVEGI